MYTLVLFFQGGVKEPIHYPALQSEQFAHCDYIHNPSLHRRTAKRTVMHNNIPPPLKILKSKFTFEKHFNAHVFEGQKRSALERLT